MAKGQKRSGREPKKPKQKKVAKAPAPSFATQQVATGTPAGKKP